MTEDGKKAAIGIGVAALVGGGIYLATKKPKEGAGAQIDIKVYDAEGNLVPKKSPITINEGASYTIVVTVTNQTMKAGEPWEAELKLSLVAYVDGNYFYDGVTTGVKSYLFGPGEVHDFSFPIDVPVGYGGLTGVIDARVISPENIDIASATEPLDIATVAIDYGATITII